MKKTREERCASKNRYRLAHKEEFRASERKYYALHKDKINERQRQYRIDHPEESRAWKRKYNSIHREEINERSRKERATHPEKYRERARRYYAMHREECRSKKRIDVFNHYGHHCVCCGETEPAFLQIDHINGGGNKHRKELGQGRSLYDWLRQNKYPKGFQVLCANCNSAKGHYGICPHQLQHTRRTG
jgi:hypothetical protein